MSCALATLIGCVQLSGVYVDVSVVATDGMDQYGVTREQTVFTGRGAVETTSTERATYSHDAGNPYARFAVGVEKQFSQRCRAYAEFWHLSSLATGRDLGGNAAALGTRCYIFGARP